MINTRNITTNHVIFVIFTCEDKLTLIKIFFRLNHTNFSLVFNRIVVNHSSFINYAWKCVLGLCLFHRVYDCRTCNFVVVSLCVLISHGLYFHCSISCSVKWCRKNIIVRRRRHARTDILLAS